MAGHGEQGGQAGKAPGGVIYSSGMPGGMVGGIKPDGTDWMAGMPVNVTAGLQPMVTSELMQQGYTAADIMRQGGGMGSQVLVGGGTMNQGMGIVPRAPQSSAEAIQLNATALIASGKVRGLSRECRSTKQTEQTRKAQSAKKAKSKPNTVVIHDILAKWLDDQVLDPNGLLRRRVQITRAEITPQGRPKELSFTIDDAEKFTQEVRVSLARNQGLESIEQYTLTTNLIRARCTPGWYKFDGSDNYRSSLSPNDWKSPEWKLSPRNWSKSTHENFEDKLEAHFFPYKRRKGDGTSWLQNVTSLQQEAVRTGIPCIYIISPSDDSEDLPPPSKRAKPLDSPKTPSRAPSLVPEPPIMPPLPVAQPPPPPAPMLPTLGMGTTRAGTKTVQHTQAVEQAVKDQGFAAAAAAAAAAKANAKRKICLECKLNKKLKKECRVDLNHDAPEYDADPRYKPEIFDQAKKTPGGRRGKGGQSHEANAGISLLAAAATLFAGNDGQQQQMMMESVSHSALPPATPGGIVGGDDSFGELGGSQDYDEAPGTPFGAAGGTFSRPCVSRQRGSSAQMRLDEIVQTPRSAAVAAFSEQKDEAVATLLGEAETMGAIGDDDARMLEGLPALVSSGIALQGMGDHNQWDPAVRRLITIRDGIKEGANRTLGSDEGLGSGVDIDEMDSRLVLVTRILDEICKVPGVQSLVTQREADMAFEQV